MTKLTDRSGDVFARFVQISHERFHLGPHLLSTGLHYETSAKEKKKKEKREREEERKEKKRPGGGGGGEEKKRRRDSYKCKLLAPFRVSGCELVLGFEPPVNRKW